MVLRELLREIEGRGVELVPAGDRLRFRPKRNLTSELVEGLREHKAAIVEALEHRDPLIRDVGEVLEMARSIFQRPADPVIPKAPPGRDPLVRRDTQKARFYRGVRARDLQKRQLEDLPHWIRMEESA